MWYECQECPAQGNSPKHAAQHVADTGHHVDIEED